MKQATEPDVFMSVSAYTLGKALGVEAAMAELRRQNEHPDSASVPSARVVGRLNKFCSLSLRLDTGGTVLGKVRSRHAHAAWESKAPVWLSCDEDVEATTETLLGMLEAVDDIVPSIVLAPCLVRGERERLNLEMPTVVADRYLSSDGYLAGDPHGALLRQVRGGGFGLVAMNRLALEAVREVSSHLAYVDDDNVERLGLFHDEIRERRWLGEDLAFFARVPKSVRVEAILSGATSHDGATLRLESLR